MNGRTMAAVVVGALVGLGVVALLRAVDAQRPKGDDATQLRQMLIDGESAAERRDGDALCRLVSKDYRDNIGLSDANVKYQIRQYLRRQQSIDVVIPQESVQVQVAPDGRTGSVSFTAAVTATPANSTTPATSTLPLTLSVAKERVHYLWLFPGEEWRITAADGYGGLSDAF